MQQENQKISDDTKLKIKTVILLGDDKQFTINGDIEIEDSHGVNIEPEIEEVVEDYLVKCYTIK